MSTPTGNYDGLDALAAASDAIAPTQTADALPPASLAPATDFSFVAEGRPGVSMLGFLITPDDNVQFTVWNRNGLLTSVTLQLRVLKPDGTIVLEEYTLQNLTNDRTPNTLTVNQLSGYLVGVVVGPPGVVLSRGQTFTQVAVSRGTPTNPLMLLVLVADYLTSAFQPTWPGAQIRGATEGPGMIVTYLGAVPGTGAETLVNQPPRTRWRLLSAFATLETAANAGNREPTINLSQGSQTLFQVAEPTPIPASQTVQCSWGSGVSQSPSAGNVQGAPLPIEFYLADSGIVTTATIGMFNADQWSALAVQVEEWIDV
jgi:hypothetical protein